MAWHIMRCHAMMRHNMIRQAMARHDISWHDMSGTRYIMSWPITTWHSIISLERVSKCHRIHPCIGPNVDCNYSCRSSKYVYLKRQGRNKGLDWTKADSNMQSQPLQRPFLLSEVALLKLITILGDKEHSLMNNLNRGLLPISNAKTVIAPKDDMCENCCHMY